MRLDPLPHWDKIDASAFVAPDAVVVGDVMIGPEASLWFGVVVRGDVEAITIGAQTNVQDGCILHADAGQPCQLGNRVSLGHGAIVHAARVDDDVLIGMRATVLNRAHIGAGSIVAAGAVITPDTEVPPHSLVMGIPGKVVRVTSAADREQIHRTAEHYVEYARAYRAAYPRPKGATMDALQLLRGVAVFDGLSEGELERVAGICRPATFHKGDELTQQGGDGSQIFLIREGLLEVTVGELPQGGLPAHTVVNLGDGQVVGEMSLVDHGPRSATVRCVTDACDVLIVERQAFEQLCEAEHHIGMVVYRNLAADLSFKLRHRHLARR